MIEFTCPRCKEEMCVPEELSGKTEKCPACGFACLVPPASLRTEPVTPNASAPVTPAVAVNSPRGLAAPLPPRYTAMGAMATVSWIIGGLVGLAGVLTLLVAFSSQKEAIPLVWGLVICAACLVHMMIICAVGEFITAIRDIAVNTWKIANQQETRKTG